jgi:hypothetical protein
VTARSQRLWTPASIRWPEPVNNWGVRGGSAPQAFANLGQRISILPVPGGVMRWLVPQHSDFDRLNGKALNCRPRFGVVSKSRNLCAGGTGSLFDRLLHVLRTFRPARSRSGRRIFDGAAEARLIAPGLLRAADGRTKWVRCCCKERLSN